MMLSRDGLLVEAGSTPMETTPDEKHSTSDLDDRRYADETPSGDETERRSGIESTISRRSASQSKMDEIEDRIRRACQRGDHRAGAAIILAEYGPQLRGFLGAMVRDPTNRDDAFSTFSEDLVQGGLARFRWQGTARTYVYALARNAARRCLKAEWRHAKRREPLGDDEVAAPLRTRTESYLKTDFKARALELRERLSPDDRALLMMHVHDGMEFPEIAAADFQCRGENPSAEELKREADRLRQRFRRTKKRLKCLAIREGLIPAES